MDNINIKEISIIGSKIGIVLLFLFVIFMILQWSFRKIIQYPKSVPKGIAADIPHPPKLQYFGRGVSESISINVFANILYERGIDWTELKVGYRPDILKNPNTGRNLEIDAYCESIRVGIEYNGIQHYTHPNPFHPDTPEGKKKFDEGIERDKIKHELCKKHNITLIEIPYWVDTCVRRDGDWKYKKSSNVDKWGKIKSHLEKAF